MGRRTRTMLFGALSLGVVVVTFAVVLPRIASYHDVWDAVRTLDTAWLVALGVAVVANVVTYAPPWMIALPGLRFRQALPFTQASTAFTYVAPGGGLVGMAGSYGLLRTWGFAPNDVARAVTVTGIWNQLANLLLPVLAVMLLGIEGGRDAFLTTVAVVGAAVFTVVVGVLALVLWTDGFAGAVGELAERLVSRLLRIVRRGPVTGWPESFVRFRRETVDLIRKRWHWLTLAAIAGNLTVFVVLLFALRAVGVDSHEVTGIEAFAGWSLARALQLIPLTPGGVGPVELGLTAILVGFGGANAEVVAAVLLYRLFTIVPTLLLGLATIAAWRWLGPRRGLGRSRTRGGESAGRMKEQSHKEEMSAAVRGDFQRLRARGVTVELGPQEERPDVPPLPELPEPLEAPVAEEQPHDEPAAPVAERRGWLSRLAGR